MPPSLHVASAQRSVSHFVASDHAGAVHCPAAVRRGVPPTGPHADGDQRRAHAVLAGVQCGGCQHQDSMCVLLGNYVVALGLTPLAPPPHLTVTEEMRKLDGLPQEDWENNNGLDEQQGVGTET